MQTHQIQILHGSKRVLEIRRELFAFPEVLEVFTTGRPDALVVVCAGRPRPAAWLRSLRNAGYDAVARRPSRRVVEPNLEREPGQVQEPSQEREPGHPAWAPARTPVGTLEYLARLG